MSTIKMGVVAIVRWVDSSIYRGLVGPDDLTGPSEMESAGFVIAEDDKSISLALDRSVESGNFRCVLCIPKICVRQIMRYP